MDWVHVSTSSEWISFLKHVFWSAWTEAETSGECADNFWDSWTAFRRHTPKTKGEIIVDTFKCKMSRSSTHTHTEMVKGLCGHLYGFPSGCMLVFMKLMMFSRVFISERADFQENTLNLTLSEWVSGKSLVWRKYCCIKLRHVSEYSRQLSDRGTFCTFVDELRLGWYNASRYCQLVSEKQHIFL